MCPQWSGVWYRRWLSSCSPWLPLWDSVIYSGLFPSPPSSFTYSKPSGATLVEIPSPHHTVSMSGPSFKNLPLALLQLRTSHICLAWDNESWRNREHFFKGREEMMTRMKKQKTAMSMGWVLNLGLPWNLFRPPVWKTKWLQNIF